MRENFQNKVIKEVLAVWPEFRLVHEKPRYPQSQGSVERANRDVEAILACWMKDNNTTQWSNGLRFVQWQKNTGFHSGIGRTPYEAMYGEKAHLGISAVNIPEEIMEGMETEEQLVVNEDQNVEEGRSAESCAINCN
ncbi:KRAB-A domain-containing protein 2-like [Palaemon carinicauda]|uniref:KRAB-A domain-containing protein 2-like n=1 Tax=Palaemon carinicauda TaxID=392227 RepID=UPI0035B690D8